MTIGSGSFSGGKGHGGNVHLLSRVNPSHQPIIDFSANINPVGPPSWLRRVISSSVADIVHYPDPDCFEFVNKIAEKRSLHASVIVPANGTTELLYHLPRVLNCKRAVFPVPSYIDYQKSAEINQLEVIPVPLSSADDFQLNIDDISELIEPHDLVILGSPNNPTANVIDAKTILTLAGRNSDSWFVVDEAFLDFVEDGKSVAGTASNIITLHSLTKFYAIPGLRLGYGVFPEHVAEALRNILPPWSVNCCAQAVGSRLFGDSKYHHDTLVQLKKLREELFSELQAFDNLKVFPSTANYFLVKINADLTAKKLYSLLLEHQIAIRVCDNYHGLDHSYFRVAVRTRAENQKLVQALATVFNTQKKDSSGYIKKQRSLMIQGTSSNAGKSVLVAALCRIMVQDGFRVAPFKAQNMSLNSFVTHDGLEMGRAQVVQAQAARLDPDVRMNPVLLKPNSDIGSQVIVQGKPVGNMAVKEYVAYKDKAFLRVKQSFDELADEYDAIVLEGAGSPGEINLKHHDIVNMQMARYADSPVLLVGDIDRGGVYASFIGTMEVFEEWERELVAGFLVNRFRGDATLLDSAHKYLFEHTAKPVLGTVPYIAKLGIPEEDSVSFKGGKLQKKKPDGAHVEVALINIPHISNFTDIEPFLDEPDVYLKIVHSPDDLDNPGAIILPGSKNVITDLEFLKSSGLAQKITEKARNGCEIVGICGGYQMLGKGIHDPHGIESDFAGINGLGLLHIETTLEKEKTLTRKTGVHVPSGLTVQGYEIHHGISHSGSEPVLRFADHSFCGTLHDQKQVWGTYLHGIFDEDRFRRWFIDNLRQSAGLKRLETIQAPYNLEHAFDRLADVVRESVDLDAIYQILDK